MPNELERHGAEVAYVKSADGLEVDFLARRRAAGEDLIQVCADPSDPGTRVREVRALLAAAKEHPRATLRLLALHRDGLETGFAPGIRAQPVCEWLLETP